MAKSQKCASPELVWVNIEGTKENNVWWPGYLCSGNIHFWGENYVMDPSQEMTKPFDINDKHLMDDAREKLKKKYGLKRKYEKDLLIATALHKDNKDGTIGESTSDGTNGESSIYDGTLRVKVDDAYFNGSTVMYDDPFSDTDDEVLSCDTGSDVSYSPSVVDCSESSDSDCPDITPKISELKLSSTNVIGNKDSTINSGENTAASTRLNDNVGVNHSLGLEHVDNLDVAATNSTEAGKKKADSTKDVCYVSTSSNVDVRKWDRKNICLFCRKPQSKLSRHLSRKHSNELRVQKLLSFSKGSRERSKEALKLKHDGNYQHNIRAIQDADGEIIVAKRSKKGSAKEVSDYVPCSYCKGFFNASELWRHSKVCYFKDAQLPDSGLRVGKALLLSACKDDGSSELFENMKMDDVGLIIKSDRILRMFGLELFKKMGKTHITYIRTKMREVGRLVKAIRALKDEYSSFYITDILKSGMFDNVIKCVQQVCGLNTDQESTYDIPSLALKIGYSLKRCCQILLGVSIREQDSIIERDVTYFLKLHEMEFTSKISTVALQTLSSQKSRRIKLLPITKDIIKLTKYINECMSRLIENFCPETEYKDLAIIALSHLITFNKRRSGEMARMRIADFSNRPDISENSDVASMLTPTEKHLAQRLCLIQIKGKRGRTVPVIVTPHAFKAIELLVDNANRAKAAVSEENTYVFPMLKNSHNSLRGWDALATTVAKADLEKPHTIKATLLRQYIATVSQILNMTEHEMDWLATHLGHDIRVHRNFYRLRNEHVELAKVSKLLYAVDCGDVHKYAGKKLDDITADDLDITLVRNGDFQDDVDCDIDSNRGVMVEGHAVGDVNETIFEEPTCTEGVNGDEMKTKSSGSGKRCPHKVWSRSEKDYVERYFYENIVKMDMCGIGKKKCEEVRKKSGTLLQNRSWIQIKSAVKNIIDKKKRIANFSV